MSDNININYYLFLDILSIYLIRKKLCKEIV